MGRQQTTKQIQGRINALLTTADVCRLLRRTKMSISIYINRANDPLPVVRKGSRIIGYVKGDVVSWARRNGIHTGE